MQSTSPHRRRRYRRALAITVALSLSPAFLPPSVVVAEGASAVDLSLGDQGDSVRSVQQALIARGYAIAGGADGSFGAATESALRSFQQREGILVSGTVNTPTAVALGLIPSEFFSLGPGSEGRAVMNLQQQLTSAGIVIEDALGIFGASTQAGVETFQRQMNVTPTGSVDASTAVFLENLSYRPVRTTESAPPAPQPEAQNAGESSDPESSGDDRGEDADGISDGAAADDGALRKPIDPNADGTPDDDLAEVDAGELAGLEIGSSGAAVVRLQRLLIRSGFSVVGGPDGIYGVLTANAVRSFQNANGLPETGTVDIDTANALVSALIPPEEGNADDEEPASSSALEGLRFGSVGADVRALQEALIDLGISVRGGADGIFGPATAAALKEFQAGQGIAETGRVDEATVGALAAPVAPQGVSGGGDGGDDHDEDDHDHDHGDHDHDHGDDDGWPEYGERGDRVRALQTALVEAGIPLSGGVDGVFGGGTSAAVMEFQRRNDLPVTGRVDDATAAALGLSSAPAPEPVETVPVSIEVFPMQGPCWFSDTWGAPRSGGRTHQGTDIIGAEGLELYAAADGTITKIYENYALAGNGVRLTMDDGTYFFYAHMTHVAEGLEVGSRVQAGDVVGYNGSTGNAGTAHLHFEVHPGGGAAINPYPLLVPIDGC